jgi:hypothetical protein
MIYKVLNIGNIPVGQWFLYNIRGKIKIRHLDSQYHRAPFAPFNVLLLLFTNRRKRSYARQDLDELLANEGIKTSDLMPKKQPNGIQHVQLNSDPDNPAPFAVYLPLEVFDNAEHDGMTPDEWLNMGVENDLRKPIPSRALLPTRDNQHHCE